MSDKFQNKYRIPSSRLKNWDYGSNAMYFITICTQNREHYFGEIENKVMVFSDIGKMSWQCWQDIPNHFPFVELGEFIVMPNHVHGIIIIDNGRDAINRVSTETETETETEKPIKKGGFAGNKNPMLNNNLSRILRWYKGRVAFESRKFHSCFAWQSRFHDHIIRNDKSFQNISKYIKTNPSNWKEDIFFQRHTY